METDEHEEDPDFLKLPFHLLQGFSSLAVLELTL
uniref:Uncharacterized protein n=1 Tax=Trichinella nativa TaxID=6335 RepID=A0A0V1KIV3_9BILA